MKKIVTSTLIAASTIAFAVAQAPVVAGQVTVNGGAINNFIILVTNITNSLIPVAVTVAVLSFFWFLITFIAKGGGDGEKRKSSLAGMGWSIVALFVMVSIWGLVGFLGSITGIGQGGKVPLPGVVDPR